MAWGFRGLGGAEYHARIGDRKEGGRRGTGNFDGATMIEVVLDFVL